ncbi:hypothetical protein THAOC_36027, partial [Thalassiosira oceanica]
TNECETVSSSIANAAAGQDKRRRLATIAGTFFPEWAACILFLPYEQNTPHASPRNLLAQLVMMTGPDRNRRHGIVSALPRLSCRAAAGRWKAELSLLQGLLSTLTMAASSFEPSQWSSDINYSMMRGRIGDPEASAPIFGNRGFVPTNSRWHRRIPSMSNCC